MTNDIQPYCDCEFPSSIQIITSKGNTIHQLCKCDCFDDEKHDINWSWDTETGDTETFIDDTKLIFHPEYSQGTQIIRGNKRLEPKMIHYWEIQVCTSLTGTDEMFGIGTDKVVLNKDQFEFTSSLGADSQSWAFSYRGLKQHDGNFKTYGEKVSRGCIVGIYLDLYRGYMEVYINRKSMGIAYDNIPTDFNTYLYPMVCSTSSRTAFKLINSTSQPECLQFQAIRNISNNDISELTCIPGLKLLMQKYWFVLPSRFKYSYRSKKSELPIEDEAVLPLRSKKAKFKYEDYDANDIYSNLRIPVNESDNNVAESDYLYYLF